MNRVIVVGLPPRNKLIIVEKGEVKISYNVIKEIGPDHDKSFIVEVSCDGKKLAEGVGKSKKIAEMQAAKKALESLK